MKYLITIFQSTFVFLLCLFNFSLANDVIKLTSSNYKEVLNNHELVFMNFYADWCGFSRSLAPEFEQAATTVRNEFDAKKVVFAKIDCEQERDLASEFKISKYPTLKQVIDGKLFKNEYRGGRSAKALVAHIKNLLKDPVVHLASASDIESKVTVTKGAIIGYFGVEPNTTQEYQLFSKMAKILKNDCDFFWATGEASVTHQHQGMQNFLVYKDTKLKPSSNDLIYPGSLLNFNQLFDWVQSQCIPLVREITFDNAEQLTEDRIPFMILFYKPGDIESIKQYTEVIKSELRDETNAIHFLTANGKTFEHPLHHLSKSINDLPLIVIDSFRHMYTFPKFNDIHQPGRLKQFIRDLHSGKLHREYHFGPDPETREQPTSPPESSFAKLQPSSSRYSILKDEL